MLKNIRLINYLTIKNLEIKFTDKLNILTGETGAGKSLILSSIELFISKRFPKELKRKKNENLEIILEIQDDDEIILLKRACYKSFCIENLKSTLTSRPTIIKKIPM